MSRTWNPEELEVISETAWDCEFNWKVLVENFMEWYHHIGAHCEDAAATDARKGMWTEEERPASCARASAAKAIRAG